MTDDARDRATGPVPAAAPPSAAPVGGSGRAELVTESQARARPGWKENLATFARNRFALAGLVVLVLFVLFCFVGPLLYSTNQTATNLINANLSPSGQFPLGTNPEGFDILGRLMLGGQSTLEVGFAAAIAATMFGALWGAVAGYTGGFLDALLMRVVDTMLSIPFLFFVVLLGTLLQPTLPLIVLAISSVSWLSTARVVRGETLSLRTRDYVVAARGFGSRHFTLVMRHIVPNALGAIVVNATLKVADAILLFASISFLGLGEPPPATNWGRMLTTGINNLFDGYWWQLWPAAIAIVATVVAINAIGDGLHDVVEKRLRSSHG
ncbi:MAG: ABC transporter permease [Actinomycetota bacterium]|nr:ABC transporter permease [Actinomycetota bacterium]